MTEEYLYKLIHKDLTNRLSQEEELELKKWIDFSDENFKLFNELKKIWEISTENPIDEDVNINEELNKLKLRIIEKRNKGKS